LRTVYLGTSEFAGAVLRLLSESAHRPILVVSRPDSAKGRGRKLAPPPTVDVARELGVPVYQPESVNSQEAYRRIADERPEVVVVCAFGALIREPLLDAYPIINVHPSMLPRWRGAAPIERAILAGDSATGVSIMRLTAGLDDGPVFLQEPVPIEPEDDYGRLAERLERLGGNLLIRALDGSPRAIAQDEREATYAEKLAAEDRLLDPLRPAAELARRIRALSPHIGAYVRLDDGTRLGVWRARAVDVNAIAPESRHPGKILLDGPAPVLVASDGALELLEVQPPAKTRMDGDAYLRGLKR
jgi:methionyl-tRNA formyltransferase